MFVTPEFSPAMTNGTPELSTLVELRGFVEQTICDQKQLLRGTFPLHEKLLVRNGEPCGLHFTLNGLRAVQFSAIWDATRHTVLFYDCSGERFHRSELTDSAGLREELDELAQMKLAG